MKNKLLYIASALLAFAGFTSCDDDWETPPSGAPTVPAGITANTSIADFKDQYWSTERNSATEIGKTADGKDIIIRGRVVSSDSAGNIYKNLVIQDLETGDGLTISLDTTSIYKTWQIGQEVVINLTGLYAGMYNNLFQLGGLGEYNGAPSMTFAAASTFKEHAWCDGLSNWQEIDTTEVTLAELRAANNNPEQRRHYMSRIVRIKDVRWDGGGKLTFAEPASVANNTNRYIKDSDNNRIIVRNSSHATFQGVVLPKGTGSVTGILSYYGTDGWQLMLNNLAGVDFEDWSVDTPVDPSELEANTTIAEFKQLYWSSERNSATLVGKTANDEDMVIRGRVVSSDAAGNVYKNLIIQDTETGEGLTIGINAKNLYLEYPVGQEILIKVTGLYAGMYNNLFQLGGLGEFNGAPSMTFAEKEDFTEKTVKVGTPDPSAVKVTTVTIPELTAANANADQRRNLMSRMVKLENMTWDGGGSLTYAEPQTNTNRYLIDASGKKILVRNSGYASFQSNILPAGTGSVTAILSYYATDWQLVLNDTDACQGFN